MSLDKVEDKKNKLRNLNSQLKYNKNNLKETLIFCSHRAENSENQTQNFILQLVRLQHKLDLPTLQGIYY